MATAKTEKEVANQALEEAIGILKGKGLRLWKELDVTKSAVSQWKLDGRWIPPKHCPKIQELTDGRVTADRLNAQVFRKQTHA